MAKNHNLKKNCNSETNGDFEAEHFRDGQEEPLEAAVVRLLKQYDLQLALAESCTGGAIAARIVNVPGASQVFSYGFVTYSEKAKHKCLGVRKSTLRDPGVVSAKCAREMAEGCRKAARADIGISVTGLAGPDGGTEKTPVGTVYIGCSMKNKTIAREFFFKGSRSDVRNQAAECALRLLETRIQKYFQS